MGPMNAEQKEFREWRRRLNAGLPELAARIFALRGRTYSGCGFHYGLECDLGQVLAAVNDYTRTFDLAAQIGLSVQSEMLHQSVARAEASADEWDRRERPPLDTPRTAC
jgi:hypothetical protein